MNESFYHFERVKQFVQLDFTTIHYQIRIEDEIHSQTYIQTRYRYKKYRV